MVRNYVINVIDRVTGATRFVRGIVHQGSLPKYSPSIDC